MKTTNWKPALIIAFMCATLAVRAQTNAAGPIQYVRPATDSALAWRHTFKFMPLSLLGQGLEIGYEGIDPVAAIGYHFSAGVFLGTNPWFYNKGDRVKDIEYTGFKAEFQPRFYIKSTLKKRDSWFLAPSLTYKYISLTNFEGGGYVYTPNGQYYVNPKDVSCSAGSLGLVVGLQKKVISGFVIDMYLGGILVINSNVDDAKSVTLDVVNPYNRGVYIKLGLSLGFSR